jgi:hypothetical protein
MKNNKKTHFEIMCDISRQLIARVFKQSGVFYEVIDGIQNIIQKEHGEDYNVFKHDDACRVYLTTIYKELYGKELNEQDVLFNRAAFYETYLPYMFYKNGKKVFKMTKNLVHMLLDTSLKNIDAFFIELPFKSIYLSLPDDIQILNPFGIPINGIYLTLLKNDEVKYKNMSEEFHHYANDKTAKSLLITATSNVLLKLDDPRESLYYCNLTFTEGDLFKQINKFVDSWMSSITRDRGLNRTFIKNLFSFIVNTILYINSSNVILRETKPKKSDLNKIKNKKKQRKAQKRSQLSFYPLGEDITIGHNYTKIIHLSHKDRAEYTKRTGQFIVRGHWRQQAHGPKFSKRKPLWIEPYVKGDKFDELINKSYKVK